MSALSIQVPFPVFQGRDGQPLENGYVWIGEPNLNPQTNPVVAYYDEALTIVAAQPLRTLNGYISRAGTPAQIYVDGVNFSILVQDSKGTMVYNFPDGTGISPDACGVTYNPPFAGSVPYQVCEKLAQTVSVMDFGAVGDGVTDDTAAIQAAIDTGKDVIFTDASYLITAPLQVGSQRLTGGVGSKWTNRAQSRILINGNHAAFINKAGFPSFVIDGFYVYYGTTTPTNAGTSSEKIAFKFVTTGGGWPEIVHIQNCTARGAWYGYYDDTGTYLSKLTQVICRNTRTGFYKEVGTTIEFDTCASSDGIQGFNIFSVLSATLLNCAADALTIDNTTPNFSGNAFRFIPGLTIIGWDGEYNTVTNTSATTTPELIPSYMRFHNTSATVSGIATLQNSLVSSQANTGVTFFMVGDNSTVQFTGFDINKEANDLTFTGSLCPVYTIYAVNTAKTTVIGCDVKAPTGGTPTVRYSLFGTLSAYISVINSLYDNSTVNVNLDVNQDTVTVQKLLLPTTTNAVAVGTTTSIGSGQQYGGFGNESATFQKNGDTVLFSTTGIVGSGTPASFARGNAGPLQYFFKNGTAVGHIDAAGTNAVNYFTTNTVFFTSGSGSPEGVLSAPVGCLYTRTDGGAGTTLYVKESGTGTTGWVAK